MDIRRGIIRAFDSGTYLADVQIVGSMATMLTGVPVAKQIGADLLASGAKCGVLFFDETNPSDACVVFVYDGVPVPWITSTLIKDGEITIADLATEAAVHHSRHENGGADEIGVAGLSGVLADAQNPVAHATSHQDGGSDEISVQGLSGDLADAQDPKAHAASHQDGGSDEVGVGGLSGVLADKQDADKLQGRDVSAAAPSDGDVPTWVAASSEWQPQAPAGGGDQHFFIPASGMTAVDGAPSLEDIGGGATREMPSWCLDQTVTEGVGSQLVVPSTGTLVVKYYYAMKSATSGNVVVFVTLLAVVDNGGVKGPGTQWSVVSAVPSLNGRLRVVTVTSSFAVTAGDFLRITAGRFGGDASDTASGDLHFLGIGFQYV